MAVEEHQEHGWFKSAAGATAVSCGEERDKFIMLRKDSDIDKAVSEEECC